MIHAILEMTLSLLAVLGLLSLGWLLFGRILTPGPLASSAFAVIPAQGDGAALEQTVKALLWLRAGEVRRYTLVIADAGLDTDGAAVAQRLAQREAGIVFCTLNEVPGLLRQAARSPDVD